jgi:hypothetical protein
MQQASRPHDKELASLKQRRCGGDSYNLAHHNVRKACRLRAQDQTTRRHHAFKAALFIHNIEVDDASGGWMLAKPL